MFSFINRALGFEKKNLSSDGNLSLDQLLHLFSSGPTASEIHISPESALKCSIDLACIKVLSESVAQLPLPLYKRLPAGGKEKATDHPLYYLLHDAPNEWTSSFDFRSSMMRDLLSHGHAFAFKNWAGGRIVELIQLPRNSVTIKVEPGDFEPRYLVMQADGSQKEYSREDIFHLRHMPGAQADQALSPIMQAKESIALALAMEKHAAKMFAKGARPAGVLKFPMVIDEEMAKRIKASWQAAHGGHEHSGGTAILEAGGDYLPMQFNSVDLQFLELRRFQIAEISRAFRIPLHLINDLERTTHHNAAEMGRQFLSFTLLPWLKIWEQGIRLQLLTRAERSEYFAEFIADDLTRADIATRFAAYFQATGRPWATPNEIRAADNRPPIAGGDTLYAPVNTAPAGGGDA